MSEEKKADGYARVPGTDWLTPWDDGIRVCQTGGNRCPRCGEPYPDHEATEDTLIYAVADALRMHCRCRRCGLGFDEFWMWIDDVGNHKFDLTYQSTVIVPDEAKATGDGKDA